MREVPVDRRREIQFQKVPQPDGTLKDQISGRQFDPSVVNQMVQLGATEEWTISNATEFWHPFHIHINDFQVVALNGQPYEAHGYEDTFPVPPHGSFTMRIRFTDFTGRFVFFAAQNTIDSSRSRPDFMPKEPPTSVATTRSALFSMPNMFARASRRLCGLW